MKNWGDTVIKSVNRIQKDGFGLIFDHQFERTCTAQSAYYGRYRNEFCKPLPVQNSTP